ncbi:unnamed protein product, partial [Polarella glacialis]
PLVVCVLFAVVHPIWGALGASGSSAWMVPVLSALSPWSVPLGGGVASPAAPLWDFLRRGPPPPGGQPLLWGAPAPLQLLRRHRTGPSEAAVRGDARARRRRGLAVLAASALTATVSSRRWCFR